MKNPNSPIFQRRSFFDENRTRNTLYRPVTSPQISEHLVDHQLEEYPEMDIQLIVKKESEKEENTPRHCKIKIATEKRVQSYLNTLAIEPFSEEEF